MTRRAAAEEAGRLRFTRGYSRTYGNNIWHCRNYAITRGGCAYWGYTGYTVKHDEITIGTADTFMEAQTLAKIHAEFIPKPAPREAGVVDGASCLETAFPYGVDVRANA
jgi:hypothetical protein